MADLEKLAEELSNLTVMEAADLAKVLRKNGVSLLLRRWRLPCQLPVEMLVEQAVEKNNRVLCYSLGNR